MFASSADNAPRGLSRGLLPLLVLVFVAFSVQYSIKVLTPRKEGLTRSAIMRWSEQLQAMEDGENIHKTRNYPNPPIMALILWPISELAQESPLGGALFWYYLKVAMAIWCIVASLKLCSDGGPPFPVWAAALAVVLSMRPIHGDLTHGNVNLFILLLVTLCLVSFHEGRDIRAGIWLALAVACKVTPALLVGYFLWKGSWKVLAGVAVGLVLFFLIVPGALLGWERNLEALSSWFDGMVKPFVVGGQVTPEHQNQSLPGLLYRMLTDLPSFVTFVNDVYTPTEYHNIASLSATTAKWLVKGCMGAFVLLVVFVCRTPVRRAGQADRDVRHTWRLAAEFSIVLVGMLLFSERTWKHHCVTLLLPFATLCYGVAVVPMSKFGRATVLVSLVGSTLLIASTMTFPGAERFGKLAQVYGAYTWAFVAQIVGSVALLRCGADVRSSTPLAKSSLRD